MWPNFNPETDIYGQFPTGVPNIPGAPQQPEPWDNYGGEQAVSFDIWQRQLAFDRDGTGENRETIARTRDAREAYDNYVKTWTAADADLRNAIDIQHGFAFAPPAPVETPEIGGGGGGGGGGGYDDRIRDAAEAPRDEITPPATGLEDTTHTEKDIDDVVGVTRTSVIDRTPYDDVKEARVLNNFVPDTPESQVQDPVTGQIFNSPAAARKAGIVNWVYADGPPGRYKSGVTSNRAPVGNPADTGPRSARVPDSLIPKDPITIYQAGAK